MGVIINYDAERIHKKEGNLCLPCQLAKETVGELSS